MIFEFRVENEVRKGKEGKVESEEIMERGERRTKIIKEGREGKRDTR